MVAYPFIYFPTLEELAKNLAANYQVEIRSLSGVTQPGSDQPIQGDYFFRDAAGIKYIYPVPYIKAGERLTPNVLRAILRALNIDPKDFGFVLD